MIKARVHADLQPNCKIDPPLTVMDLTEENHLNYTDASGNSRKIVITGNRVHSTKCELLTFDLVDPAHQRYGGRGPAQGVPGERR